MSGLNKKITVIGAVALIIMDILVLTGTVKASETSTFSSFMWNMVPAGLLLGTTVLCANFDVSAKKVAGVISVIVFGFMAAFRAIAFGVFIYDRITLENPVAMTYSDYTKTAELVGYMLLMVAAIFFIMFLLKGAFRKTTTIISGISFAIIVGAWVVNLYNLINDAIFYDAAFSEILSAFISDGLVWSLVMVIAYLSTFASNLGLLKGAEKKD